MPRRAVQSAIAAAVLGAARHALAQQQVISQIALMPYLPVNYQYENYSAVAQGYDSTVFDPNAQAGYQYPTFWFQNDSENGITNGIGMPSYIGQTQSTEGNGEAITQIGAVLGASLVGINKQSQTLDNGQTYDFVQMASRFYDSNTGANLVLNNIGSQGTGSFWYDQLPQIMFDGLISEYYSSYSSGSAGRQRLSTIMNSSAAKMHNVIDVLAGNSTTAAPNFNYQGFNYVTMQPITGNHTEPDGAAGASYEQYMAYEFTGNSTYLSDAERAMTALEANTQNPLYEVILPFGALTAARLNAEQGTNFNVAELVNWSFSASGPTRPDWGAISASQWGGYGVSGLIGSTTDDGGYGFAMNTYLYPMAMVPLVRYDDRFANTIGKWMLNLSNSSRLFLKSGLPAANQANPNWNDAPSNYYSYEGVKNTYNGVTPQAGGDGTGYNSSWLNFAYGSGDIGVLGSIISPTNVPEILQLNLLATDFFHAPADPSYLMYNPYATQKSVQINVGSTPVNVYDAITDQFLATNVTGTTTITIAAEESRSLVYTPVGYSLTDNGQNVTVNGIVVNYRSPELNRLYWDLNGSSAGAGGSTLTGTWDSSSSNWNPSSAGTSATGAWAAGKVAMFAAGGDGGGTYTVTVSGTQSIGGLDFQSGSVTLTGGALSLASDSYVTTASGTEMINTPIGGSSALLKDGAGTLVLGAANTYSGITSIVAGVLQITNALALQATSVDVNIDNSLNLNGLSATLGGLSGSGAVNIGSQTLTVGNDNQNAEYAGLLSGSGGEIIKVGAGIWTLDAANPESDPMVIRAGEVSVAADASLGASTNAITFDGGTLQVTGTTFESTPRVFSETSNGSGFDIADPNNVFTMSQNLSGGTLTKIGAGTLVLTGNNSQAGLTIAGGTVAATSASNLGSGTIRFSGAGTLSFNNPNALNISSPVTMSANGTLNLGGTGIVTLSGPLTLSSGLTEMGAGTLQISSVPTGTGSVTVRSGTLEASMGTGWSIGGTSGAGGIYVADAGSNSTDNQSVLLGAGVTLNYGRLYFQGYALSGTKTLGALSSSGVATVNTYLEVQSPSINLQLTAPAGGQLALPLGILGSTTSGITITGAGTITLGGIGAAQSEYYQGTTTLQNGTVIITGNDIVGNARDTYVLGNSSYSTVVQIGTAATPASAQLSMLTDAASTINHNIAVNNDGGTIYLGGEGAFASTYNSAISLAKNLSLTAGSGGAVNFTGAITGIGGISVTGAGSVNLSGSNSFGGGVAIAAGASLVIASTGALPAGSAITNNGNLTVNANTVAGNISGGGTLNIGSSAAANLELLPNSGDSTQGAIQITNNSTLDMENNHLFITYGAGVDPIASIAALIASGYSGGTWTGKGIMSLQAQANSGSYGIAYADSADPGNPANLPSGTIEIMYTLLGDANLDGKVNGTDFTLMATNFNQAVTDGWDRGDFNYSNTVNGSDFLLLASNFNQFASQSAVSAADLAALNSFAMANGISLTSVPEPVAGGILAMTAVGLLAKRRQSRRI